MRVEILISPISSVNPFFSAYFVVRMSVSSMVDGCFSWDLCDKDYECEGCILVRYGLSVAGVLPSSCCYHSGSTISLRRPMRPSDETGCLLQHFSKKEKSLLEFQQLHKTIDNQHKSVLLRIHGPLTLAGCSDNEKFGASQPALEGVGQVGCRVTDVVLCWGLGSQNPSPIWHFLCGLREFRIVAHGPP
jgi:hypothetical protein